MSPRPNPLPRFYVWLSYGVQGPLLFLLTAVCASTAFVASVFDKNGRVQHRIARFWGRNAVRLMFSRLTIEGAENFRKHPVAVYVSNHTSYMDTPVIFGSLPFQFRILAKKDLWQWPMIGWYLGRSGQMPIDLENPHATLSSLGGAVKALRAGMPLFVFPEGGRTSDGALAPIPRRRGVSRHSRSGANRSHRAQRRLRSAAHPHQSLLSHPAHRASWRTDRHQGNERAPERRVDRASARGNWRDARPACADSTGNARACCVKLLKKPRLHSLRQNRAITIVASSALAFFAALRHTRHARKGASH